MSEKKNWFSRLQNIFTKKKEVKRSENFWEDIEDILLEADLSLPLSEHVIKKLKESTQDLNEENLLKEELKIILSPYLKTAPVPYEEGKMNLYFILGINGSGKTTTLAKLGKFFKDKGFQKNILFCAGDTFRAAASEQLTIQAQALGCDIINQKEGQDPSAVLWDALSEAKEKNKKIILIDTAGRLQNKKNLMDELKKMSKVSEKVLSGTNFIQHNILILDANIGQNALQQARLFSEMVPLSGIILTKFDGTSKSGIALRICEETKVPFIGMGEGEKREDFKEFNSNIFLDKLTSL